MQFDLVRTRWYISALSKENEDLRGFHQFNSFLNSIDGCPMYQNVM